MNFNYLIIIPTQKKKRKKKEDTQGDSERGRSEVNLEEYFIGF